MKKTNKIDLVTLNQEAQEYFYRGYDLFFIHGWFCAYLSAINDNEEDTVIATYLILDETKITNENAFSKFIDKLMQVYSELTDNVFENNKLIKPLVNLVTPNNLTNCDLSLEEKQHLQLWLYGYLNGHLAIGEDITEACDDESLIDKKFFPSLYLLCSIFLALDKEVNIKDILSQNALENYLEVQEDIINMWETEDNRTIITDIVGKSLINENTLNNIIEALNSIFYVVRTIDEKRFATQNQNQLLKNLNNRYN